MAYIDSYFFSMPISVRLLIIFILMMLIVLFSIRKKQLTGSGLIAAFIVGSVITYIGGLSGILIMLFFFLSAAVIGKIIPDNRRKIQKKGARRDAMQVLANSIPALIGLFLFRFTVYDTLGLVMFSTGIAEAVADTWSGEIGALSKSDPVSIITFTKVPKGLSGGVSALGTFSGLLGSFLVALLSVGCFTLPLLMLPVITISGTLGALFDSFLGATVQVHYRRNDGSLTEHEESDGRKNERARGISFIDNDVVNLLSGLFSVLIAFILTVVAV